MKSNDADVAEANDPRLRSAVNLSWRLLPVGVPLVIGTTWRLPAPIVSKALDIAYGVVFAGSRLNCHPPSPSVWTGTVAALAPAAPANTPTKADAARTAIRLQLLLMPFPPWMVWPARPHGPARLHASTPPWRYGG